MMPELIKNAWLGWKSYTEAGKLAVLPMAFLLFITIYSAMHQGNMGIFIEKGTKHGKRLKVLYIYTAVIMALCIFPVTAAALMLYQTKFYNYEWIWSYVPVTAVTAAGGCTVLLFLLRNRYRTSDRIKAWTAALLLAAAAVLCGLTGMYNTAASDTEYMETSEDTLVQYDRTVLVLSELQQLIAGEYDTDVNNTDKICLWAPQEILEHARQYSDDITLIYGRNMWDNALNAYAYDTYPEECENLYKWMMLIEQYGEIDYEDKTEDYSVYKSSVTDALNAGVNVIILPEKASDKTRAEVSSATKVQGTEVQGYIVYIIWNKSI
jgi:hypothetical protein